MLKQLFYSGPSIDVLHKEYAKKGRIDARAPVGAAGEIRIEVPVGRVWELLVNVPAWGPGIVPSTMSTSIPRSRPTPGSLGSTATPASGPGSRSSTQAGNSPGPGLHRRQGRGPACAGSDRRRCDPRPREESIAGPLLVLFYNSAKLRTGMEQWLTALKTAAEKR
jgi:hypothetical protein